MLFSFGFTITSAVTIWIRILYFYYIMCIPGKVGRVPGFVQDWFPHPYAGMVAVPSNHIPDVAVYPLRKDRGIVPELPTRCIDNYKQSKFIASIHESRVLRAMCITNYFHPCISQLFGIAPVNAVWYCIAHYREVLMAVSSYQWCFIRPSVQPESGFSLEFDAADPDSAAVSVYYVALFVTNADNQIV